MKHKINDGWEAAERGDERRAPGNGASWWYLGYDSYVEIHQWVEAAS